ncbi:MAG TPA: hypothetical protein EYP85_03210 [Armatimonadetes bacterium]|nr:hypothetical protein [Armatimonadota bacterium]
MGEQKGKQISTLTVVILVIVVLVLIGFLGFKFLGGPRQVTTIGTPNPMPMPAQQGAVTAPQ